LGPGETATESRPSLAEDEVARARGGESQSHEMPEVPWSPPAGRSSAQGGPVSVSAKGAFSAGNTVGQPRRCTITRQRLTAGQGDLLFRGSGLLAADRCRVRTAKADADLRSMEVCIGLRFDLLPFTFFLFFGRNHLPILTIVYVPVSIATGII